MDREPTLVWSVSSGDRFFVGAMDSSEAMVLMGLMEKAEKHGVLDEYYRQVKSGKQQDEDMFSWVSSEDRFDVPEITPKEYWCQIFENHDTRVAIPEDSDRSFDLWAKTRLELPKYQELNVNYEQCVCMGFSGHTRMAGYLEWIKSTFGHKKGDTQAYDLGAFLRRIRYEKPSRKFGFRRKFT
eukprot:symbB.v1.2.020371.t1/scaffold1707.1/size105203/2